MTGPDEERLEQDLRRVLSDPGYRLPDRLVPLERVHAGALRRRRRQQATSAVLASVAVVGLGLGIAHPWGAGNNDRKGISAASSLGLTSQTPSSPSESSSAPSVVPSSSAPQTSSVHPGTSGPLTAKEQTQILMDVSDVRSVSAISPDQWWLAVDVSTCNDCGSTVLSTSDGGSTFSVAHFGFDSTLGQVRTIRFVDLEHGTALVAGGGQGGAAPDVLESTSDGGRTWTPTAGGVSGFTALEAGGGKITWALRLGDKREVWRSVRSGPWAKVATLPDTSSNGDFAMLSVQDNRAIVVWSGDTIKTASFDASGTMTTPHPVPGCPLGEGGVLSARSISSGLGATWVSCATGNNTSDVIVRSTDYGASWQSVPFSGQYSQVGAIDDTHAVVASSKGFQAVDDKGETATVNVDGVNPQRATYVGFTTSQDGFATTDQGYLLRSTDGGQSWRKVVTFKP